MGNKLKQNDERMKNLERDKEYLKNELYKFKDFETLQTQNTQLKSQCKEYDDLMNKMRKEMEEANEKYGNYDALLDEIESFKGLEGINAQIQNELEEAKRT